jgi:hypothetical protein
MRPRGRSRSGAWRRPSTVPWCVACKCSEAGGVGHSLCLDLASYIRYVAGGGWMVGVIICRSFLLSNFLNTARYRITNRQQVFDLGKYNETCHNIVPKYISEWEAMVTRTRRRIDFKNDYKTMDLNFMESVWYLVGVCKALGEGPHL